MWLRSARCLGLVLVAWFSLCPAAIADDTEGKADRTKARAHYQAGKKAFRSGYYDVAIREFLASNELAPRALLLFNIARAYELSGDAEEAIEYYSLYLKLEPEGQASADARRFRTALQEAHPDLSSSDERDSSEPGEGAEAIKPSPGEAKEEAANEPAPLPMLGGAAQSDKGESAKTMRYLAWGALGGAAISAALTFKFFSDARELNDDFANRESPWPDDLKSRINSADGAERNTYIFGGLAVALAATSAVAFLFDSTRDSKAIEAGVYRGAGESGVALSGRF